MMVRLRKFDWAAAMRNGSLAAAIWLILLIVDTVFHALKIPAGPIDGAFTLANGGLVANLGVVAGLRNVERDTQINRVERDGFEQHQRLNKIEKNNGSGGDPDD